MEETKIFRKRNNGIRNEFKESKKRKVNYIKNSDKINELDLNDFNKTNEIKSIPPSPKSNTDSNSTTTTLSSDSDNSNIQTKIDNNQNSNLYSKTKISNKQDNEEYDLDFYDKIVDENEQVATFLEDLLKRKEKGESLESTIQIEKLLLDNKSLNTTVNEMYELFKAYNDNKPYYKDFLNNEKIVDIKVLTSHQRKLLLFMSILVRRAVYTEVNKESKWLTIKENDTVINKDISGKLTFCLLFAPYEKYQKDVTGLDYENYFNWDSLVKMNISMYNNLIVFDKNNVYFSTMQSLVYDLDDMIHTFEYFKYNLKDKELFKRFLKLQNRFVRTEY